MLTLVYLDGKSVELNLKSPDEWPLEGSPLISYYTLVHCLDRPQFMKPETCLPILYSHFCDGGFEGTRVRSDLLRVPIRSVAVSNGSMASLRRYFYLECR